MKFCFTVWWSVFVEAKIPIHFILLTLGEHGRPAHDSRTDQEMKDHRRSEFQSAANTLGAKTTVMDYGDLDLLFLTAGQRFALLDVIRQGAFGALATFHPSTHIFDHSDHRVVGELAQWLRTASDVHSYQNGKSASLPSRPDLLLLTQDVPQLVGPSHVLSYGEVVRQKRNEYLENYPSQFRQTEEAWKWWQAAFVNLAGDVAEQYGVATSELPYAEAYRVIGKESWLPR